MTPPTPIPLTDPGPNSDEFYYDGLGHRNRVVEKNNGAVVSDKAYIWCGTELCEEWTLVSGGANQLSKRFFPQGEQISGANYYFALDHLGSVREMTDSTGAIRARYDYDPYGHRTRVSGELDADFSFTGHYFHSPSGLLLAFYRAYDPDTGRWLNRDPIQEWGGLNLYGYVGNNPVNFVDPLGLDWTQWPIMQWWERTTRPLRGLNPDGSEQNPPGSSGMRGPQDDTMGLQPSLLGELLLPGGGLVMSGGASRCGAKALASAAARRQAAIQEALKTALQMRDSAGTALSVALDARKAAAEALKTANASWEYVGEQFGKDSLEYYQATQDALTAEINLAKAQTTELKALENFRSADQAAKNVR